MRAIFILDLSRCYLQVAATMISRKQRCFFHRMSKVLAHFNANSSDQIRLSWKVGNLEKRGFT